MSDALILTDFPAFWLAKIPLYDLPFDSVLDDVKCTNALSGDKVLSVPFTLNN